MRTLDAAKNIDQIDDFLTTVEMFFTVDNVGNVVPAKSLQIMLGLSEFPEQERDMPRTQRMTCACRRGFMFGRPQQPTDEERESAPPRPWSPQRSPSRHRLPT